MKHEQLTRRLFLKRASQACGVLVFLPAANALGKLSGVRTPGYYEHTILAMGTTARVGVYAPNEASASEVITAAFAELKRVERLFTIFDPGSEISQLNAGAGRDPIRISDDTAHLLRASIEHSRITNGAFDITIEPLMRLWGFRSESTVLDALPSQEQITTALQSIGSNQIHLNLLRSEASLNSENAKLDMGGIAVGYALDKMVAVLRSANIENAIVDISGDMFALGAPHGHSGWPVSVPDPQDTTKLIYTTTISNEALATSGNYMSYVTYQARRYGHIMDPHEGSPAHSILSATVIAKTGIDADACSTASFVTGERYGTSRLVLVNTCGAVVTSM